MSTLDNILFNDDTSRCVSITGLPRIGKTSIVNKIRASEKVQEYGYIVIYVTCAVLTDDISFWQSIVHELEEQLSGNESEKDFSPLFESIYQLLSYNVKVVVILKNSELSKAP